MQRTVTQLIVDSLEEIGVVAAEQPLNDADAAKALSVAQTMHDTMQADRLMLFETLRSTFPLVAAQASYTIGSGGNVNVARPSWLTYVGVTPVGDTTELEVTPYPDRKAFDAERLKTFTDAYPSRYWFEPEWPLAKLTVWPIPTTIATIGWSRPVPLATPATLLTVLSFPPGYYEAWQLNLAKRLCRPFKRKLTADLRQDAKDALNLVRRNNDGGPPRIATSPWGTRSGYDITTNSYR